MKATVIGVKRVHGIGKESGSPYDMPRALLMTAIRPASKGNFNVEGYGFEVSELPLDWALADRFAQVRFPAQLDLITDVQPVMGRFESVCVDFKPLEANVKAA